MATWTTIPDSLVEPDKPIRSLEALALRDNPIAIAEGASGAPKILDAALGPTVTAAGTNWVQNRIAAGTVGAVGTYAFLGETSTTTTAPGATRAGSGLRYAGVHASSLWSTTDTSGSIYQGGVNTAPSGTWMSMGYAYGRVAFEANRYGATLWLRIA